MLTLEEIKEISPSIFNESKMGRTSKYYNPFPTIKLIEELNKKGWEVKYVSERKVRKEINKGFQKHIVRLRLNSNTNEGNINIKWNKELGIIPELTISNSNDGRDGFNFYLGYYKLNSNTHVIFSLNSIHLGHMGNTLDKCKELILKLNFDFDNLFNLLIKSNTIVLTHSQQEKLAQQSCFIRWGKRDFIKPNSLYYSLRENEDENTLWNVFNRIQEKIINGNDENLRDINDRKVRQIKNFTQNIQINKDFFNYIYNQYLK